MVKFCNKCDGLLRPSKKENRSILICKSCGAKFPLDDTILESYTSNKKIIHPPGEEFKNLEKMEKWEKKELLKKFKE